MGRRVLGKAVACAVLALTVALPDAQAQDKIPIGLSVPLTGFGAADGKSALIGAQLAVEKANAAGGIRGKKIDLIVYDDEALPKMSVPVATKLVEKDKVLVAISGSYSGPTRAAAGVYQSAGVPFISAYAVHPDITRSGKFAFRTVLVGEVQGRAAAKFIGDTLKHKRLSLTVLKNDYGKSLAQGFKEVAGRFGIQLVGEYEYAIDEKQFGPIVSSVRRDDPDVVFDTGYWFSSAALVSQLRAGGVTATIVGQEGYDSEKFIEIAKDAAEGVMITTALDRDSKDRAIQQFMDAFKKKAGYAADMVAASANTAMTVAIAGLQKAETEDRTKIRDAIASSTVDTVVGRLSFNDLGEVRKPVQVQVVRGGAWHHHSVIDDAELLAPPTK
jgi:branched-chain amino acid transport system substrate-binding protein